MTSFAGQQSHRPTAISMSPVPMRAAHKYSPVSPGQPPLGTMGGQPMVGRAGQVSQLQRQAALHQQQLRYGPNSPLAASYAHLPVCIYIYTLYICHIRAISLRVL